MAGVAWVSQTRNLSNKISKTKRIEMPLLFLEPGEMVHQHPVSFVEVPCTNLPISSTTSLITVVLSHVPAELAKCQPPFYSIL